MISKDSIDKVFDVANIEEVIGDFINLKKAGSNFKGLSPFSKERTPSFMVSPSKQIWKDFSSGKGGNVVSFLMEHEHYTYPDAIRFLAKKYNVELEESQRTQEEIEAQNEKESLFLINEFAKKYFKNLLWNNKEGKSIGLSYFKERGFSEEVIEKFDLGYALRSDDDITQEAIKNKYNPEFLDKLGLSIIRDNWKKDKLKERVIFPIKSMAGRTLGFGARVLSSQSKLAKYINSPESEVYNKSKVLYGLYEAKQEISKKNCCYLTEGYTDVIQLYQNGIQNVVSSSGTALTEDQIRLIKRLSSKIVILFDSDEAGQRATLRGIDMIIAQDMDVKVCIFPEGEDPDSFSRKSSVSELEEYLIENEQDFLHFKANLLTKGADKDPNIKSQAIKSIVETLSKITNPVKQEIYLKSCSSQLDVSEKALSAALAQQIQIQKKTKSKASSSLPALSVVKSPSDSLKVDLPDEKYELEKIIISILIKYGLEKRTFTYVYNDEDTAEEKIDKEEMYVYQKINKDIQDDETEFSYSEFRKLYQLLLENYLKEQDLDIKDLANQFEDPKLASLLSEIIFEDEKYVLDKWVEKDIIVKSKYDQLEQLVTETILRYRKVLISDKINALEEEIEDNYENNRSLIEEIVNYNALKTRISNELNQVI